MKLGLSVFLALSFPAFWSFSEQEATPKDRLIVETLVRLKRFDVSANEKWQGAVERTARSLRGAEGYFELVEQFSVKSEAPELIRFVQNDSASSQASKAVQLLFHLDQESLLSKALVTEPKAKAEAIAKLIGFVQTPAAKKVLEAYRKTEKPSSSSTPGST